MSLLRLSVISRQPTGGFRPGEHQPTVCDSLPSVSAAGVLPFLSGDEGATSGSFRWRRAQCEGWGAWKGCLPSSAPSPPLLLWTNGKASSLTKSNCHFFKKQKTNNLIWVTSVPRGEVKAPSPAWGSCPWVECLHLPGCGRRPCSTLSDTDQG